MNSKLITNIIIVVVILIVLFYGGSLFFGKGEEEAHTGVQPIGFLSSPDAAINNEFLRLLTSVKGIDLRGDIFENIFFIGLEDQSREITPRPKGRDNPFAPRGGNKSESE